MGYQPRPCLRAPSYFYCPPQAPSSVASIAHQDGCDTRASGISLTWVEFCVDGIPLKVSSLGGIPCHQCRNGAFFGILLLLSFFSLFTTSPRLFFIHMTDDCCRDTLYGWMIQSKHKKSTRAAMTKAVNSSLGSKRSKYTFSINFLWWNNS
jgi:hypothetical protein